MFSARGCQGPLGQCQCVALPSLGKGAAALGKQFAVGCFTAGASSLIEISRRRCDWSLCSARGLRERNRCLFLGRAARCWPLALGIAGARDEQQGQEQGCWRTDA